MSENGENGTDPLKVKHIGKRVWFGISDTIMWRAAVGICLTTLVGKSFLPAKEQRPSEDEIVAIQQDLKDVSDTMKAAQIDIKELQKSVQHLDVDTGKLNQALVDLKR